MAETSQTRNTWLSILFLVLVTVVTYTLEPGASGFGGALSSGFVFDDVHLIVKNERLEAPNGVWAGFTGDYYTTGAVGATGEIRALGYYRPLAVLSTWLDYQIWERRAFGYHLTNLILHVLTVLGLFVLLRHLTTGTLVPLTAALLFAVHPAHVETVTFVSGRVDVLAAAFSVGALVALVRSWSGRAGKAWWALSLLLFFAALLSKEMAVTLPAAVFLLVALKHPNRSVERALRATLPFIGVALLYVVIRRIALGALAPEGQSPVAGIPLLSRVAVAAWEYLKLLVWPPYRFNVEPHVPFPTGIDAAVLLRLLLPAALAGAAVLAFRRRHVTTAFGLSWALLALVPVLHFIPVETAIGERYLYIPSLGMVIVIASVLTAIGTRLGGRIVAGALAGLLTVAYAANTVERNRFFEDNLTFWTAKAELDPTAESWSALGIELALDGRSVEAADAYQRALAIDENHIEALNNYALLLLDQGQLEMAHKLSARTISINPTYAPGLNTLATAFHAMGRFGEAVGQYKRALRADPTLRQAWVNLGNTYLAAGVPDSARRAYREAVALEPDRQLAILVGRCHAMSGDVDGGMAYLYETGVTSPDTPQALVLRGNLEAVSGDLGRATATILRATEIDPAYVDAWIELGQLMVAANQPQGAKAAFERALALDPNLSVAHNNLGALAEEQGDLDAAVRHYQQAQALAPNDPLVLRNLGGALLARNRPEEALAALDRSIRLFPRDALAFFTRGNVHKKRGDLSAAVSDYRSAVTLSPTFADAQVALGDLLVLKGENYEALMALRAFLSFAPLNDERRPEVEDIVRRLEQ